MLVSTWEAIPIIQPTFAIPKIIGAFFGSRTIKEQIENNYRTIKNNYRQFENN